MRRNGTADAEWCVLDEGRQDHLLHTISSFRVYQGNKERLIADGTQKVLRAQTFPCHAINPTAPHHIGKGDYLHE